MPRRHFVVASFVVILFGLACAPAERDDEGAIEGAGSVDAFTMRIGDCFDDQSAFSEEVSDVPGVPCSTAHDNEVYATFDVTLAEWPGEDQLNELANEGCLERFEPAIAASYEESVLMFTTLVPSKGSWGQRNDREVVCAAYHMELEKLTGSVLNSGM
jgi:hypothetical protein